VADCVMMECECRYDEVSMQMQSRADKKMQNDRIEAEGNKILKGGTE